MQQIKRLPTIDGQLGWFASVPFTRSMRVQNAKKDEHFDVIIIGAGFSGLATDIGTAWMSKDSYADIWIKDKATDKPVAEVVRTAPPPEPRTISYPIIIN